MPTPLEAEMRILIEHSPVSMAMFDREMRYLHVSQQWRSDHHLGDRELRGVSHYELFPEIHEHVRAHHRRALAGEPVRFEGERYQAPDGSSRWRDWESRPWHDASGNIGGILVTTLEITGRRKAEDALRESEQRLAAFFDHASSVFWIKDLDGRFQRVNPQTEQALGRRAEEIIGRTVADLVSPAEAEAYSRHDAEAAATGRTVEIVEQMMRPDGLHTYISSKFPLRDVAGGIYGLGAICTDVTARQRTERALWDSEANFRGFFENLPLGAALANQARRFIRVNEPFCQLTGYSRRELLGRMGPGDLTHPEDREADRAFFAQLDAGESFEIEKRYVRKDGSIVWVHVSGAPILDADGRFLCSAAVIEDITERRAAQEQLRHSQALLAKAEQLSNVGAGEFDLATGEFTYSDQWLAIHGCERRKFRMEDLLPIAHPDDRPAVERAFADLLAGLGPYDLEHRIIRQDTGEVRLVHGFVELVRDERGNPVKGQGIARDITERRKAEEALRESEADFRAFFENLHVGAVQINSNRCFVRVNNRYCDITGYSREELLGGMGPENLTHPEDWKADREKVDRVIAGEPYEMEKRYVRKDGRVIWVHVAASALLDAQGRFLRTAAVIEDITARKQAEEELRRSQTLLAKAEQLSHTGAFEWDVPGDLWTFSDQWLAIHGTNRLQLTTAELLPIAHPHDRTSVIREFEKLRTGTPVNGFELRIVRQDNGETRIIQTSADVVFDENGKTAKVWGAAQDITERRQAEEALRQSEERLRLMFESMPALAWQCSPQGEAIYLNQRWYDYTGEGPERSLGHGWQASLHPDDVEPSREAISCAVATGEPCGDEFRIRRHDGEYRWHIVRTLPVRDSEGKIVCWVGCGTDIEDSRQALTALQASEARLRLAQQAGRIGAFDFDCLAGEATWTAELEALHGLEPGGFGRTQESWAILLHPEDRERMLALNRQAIETGEAAEAEWRVKWPDGSVHWLYGRFQGIRDASGHVVRLIGVNLDITPRKKAESELREREQELQRVLDTASTGLARFDRDLRFIFANPPFAKLAGRPLDQIVGRRLPEVIGEQGFAVIQSHIARVLKGERVEHEADVPIPDGMRSVYAVNTPDVDSDGNIVGFFTSLTDIAERKALEREILRVSENERQRVAADLHDGICQELIAIGAASKGLQRQLEKTGHPLAPSLAAIANQISQSAAHTRMIARGMDPVVPGGEGLMDALRELAAVTQNTHSVQCRLKCPATVLIPNPLVSHQLYRIAQEAIANAVRHGKAKQIDVELTESGSDISLSVSDNGSGLAPNASSNRGLGLRAMRYRAGLIHGVLSAQEKEGGGTTVICQVPKSQEAPNANTDFEL